MAVTHVLDPSLTPGLRAGIITLWTEVSNADGAVGFVPPVTEDDVRPVAEAQLDAVAAGRVRLLVALDDGRPVGTVFLTLNTHRLMTHWCTLNTVMVHPRLQGRGLGRELVLGAVGAARESGLEGVRIEVRGGTGTDRFYAGCGFREVGRLPAAIDLGGGDRRDDIVMWLPLDPRNPGVARREPEAALR